MTTATPASVAPAAVPNAPSDIVGVFNAVLKRAVDLQVSDVHVIAGGPFRMRHRGQIVAVNGTPPLKPDDTVAIARHILLSARKATPATVDDVVACIQEADCSYAVPGVSRFRVNLCSQRGSVSVVLRAIASQLPSFEGLGLPPVLAQIAAEDRGLVLVSGATGSGKSSTLAAILSHVSQHNALKIVTIEDPIEFLFRDQKSIFIQRELGGDTGSFAAALRAAMRQDPDVIMVGEMRDRETIDIALKAAETGHLVFSTVHTSDAPKTISRLVSVFDAAEQPAVRLRLAESLRAVVSQRLLPHRDGESRVAAVEVMRTTGAIRECMEAPERTAEILEHIAAGAEQYGMQTFDQHLTQLYEQELISLEVAKSAATSPSDFVRNLEFR